MTLKGEGMDIFEEKALINLWKDAMARLEVLLINLSQAKHREECLQSIAKSIEQSPDLNFHKQRTIQDMILKDFQAAHSAHDDADKEVHLNELMILKTREEIAYVESKLSKPSLEKIKEVWLLSNNCC
ncbi:MAG: hypothetical protein WCU74_04555 [Candidatus Omnitrophota bacterium]|jgi:hypothetical protein